MSFERAVLSAVFYYVSCTPCAKRAHRRRRRQEAERSKEEKATIVMEQPGLFHQPSPFSTNIYWREEMILGPGPPPKRAGKDCRNGSQRALTGVTESSNTSSGGLSANGAEPEPVADERLSGENWNRKRYQREDELLWGHDITHPGRLDSAGSAVQGSSIGLAGMSRTATVSSSGGTYYLAKNPAVNDLHPPVVSTQPTHRNQTRWMLQPPPSAKIMEGKERATRSRSGSGTSSRRGTDQSLGKVVGERLIEGKRRTQTQSTELDLLPSGRSSGDRSNIEGSGQPHDTDPRSSADSMSTSRSDRRRNPPPALTLTQDPFTRPSLPTIPSQASHLPKSQYQSLPPSRKHSDRNLRAEGISPTDQYRMPQSPSPIWKSRTGRNDDDDEEDFDIGTVEERLRTFRFPTVEKDPESPLRMRWSMDI